jgi:DNA-binding NtrC family response regulator
VATRILIIEHKAAPCESSCVGLFHQQASCERWMWESFDPAALFHSNAQLVLACPVADTDKAVPFFHWLHENPIAVPVLAILPEFSDQELLRSVAAVTDDFVFRPLREQELNLRINRILGHESSADERIRSVLRDTSGLAQLVGNHPSFLQAVEKVPLFGGSDAPVLISGETGTGKELFAHAIHSLGARRSGPFIPLDCGALPEHLAENELFGHRRGAFTDAHTDQKGLAAMADGGTLFLDEVDALSLPNQAKLLRFLQEGTYRALGADHFMRSNARIIAATNRNLEECVRQGRFRSDLYFRLNVLRLHLPPLRERHGDVPVLARYFLENECNSKTERKMFSTRAMRKLEGHDWLGNVRELFNTIQRAFVHCPSRQIASIHISLPDGPAAQTESRAGSVKFRTAKQQVIEKFERTYLQELLARHQGNVTQAAREAGKERRALGRLAKKYGLGSRIVLEEN